MAGAMIGIVSSLLAYLIIGIALYKLMQIATELGEIKEVLNDIRRNTEARPSSYSATHSEPQH